MPTQAPVLRLPPNSSFPPCTPTHSHAHAATRSRSPQATSTSQAQHPLALPTSRRAPLHWRFAVPPLPTSRARYAAIAEESLPRRLFNGDLCRVVQRAPRSKCRGWRGAATRFARTLDCMQVQSKRVVGLADQAVLALSQSARAEQPIAVPPARTPAVPAVPGVVRR